MKKGKVYLIGTGPGDPDLITLKGIEYLKRADVVVHDQLVGYLILDYANSSAEKIYVGKTGNKHFVEQDQINMLLVAKALSGKTVARLKGGDPFVFGRGGEEAQFLKKNGIEFEIVPGVTSAIAVPAYAGIPVTHRGVSSSVAVVTGHEDPLKKKSSINWKGLATGTDTLVFLMGMANLPNIVTRLMESGRAPGTPVAIIKDGTLPAQEIVTGTLKTIVAKAKKQNMSAPAVIVIGEVVRFRNNIKWFDTMPLFGKSVLITRASLQAGHLERLLAKRSASPVLIPLIKIIPATGDNDLDNAVMGIRDYDWLILTSVNGAELFFRKLFELGMDARALAGVKVGAIGPATSECLAKYGIAVDYVPGRYTGRGLVSGMKKKNVSGKKILLLRADLADAEITNGLKNLGAIITEHVIYHTVRPRSASSEIKKLISSGKIDIITFTSSSTVTNFVHGLTARQIQSIKSIIACIGPKTAATARKAGLKVHIVAKEQTIPGLVQAVEDYFREGE